MFLVLINSVPEASLTKDWSGVFFLISVIKNCGYSWEFFIVLAEVPVYYNPIVVIKHIVMQVLPKK